MADDLNALAEYSSDEETNAVEAVGEHAPKKEDTYSSHSAGFREFLLKPEILRAIVDCGFEHPSTVQNECIPQAIVGTDVICQAKSGMGKTAVFVLAVLQQLNPSATGVQCLVLAHTRELAYQIWKEFDRFKKYMPQVKTAVLYGGVPMQTHKEMLKAETPHILIATPGRVMALLRSGDLELKSLKHFVVDECDKMLESLDMRADVQSIFTHTPHEKQVMMFSATLSDAVRPICKKFMHAPLEIYINEGSKLTLHGLKQFYVQLEEAKKSQKLVDLLDSLEFNQVVIFCSSVRRATLLNKIMTDCSFPSICIHGAMPQEERISNYKLFKEFKARIMVATDLIGRGIDIERVNVVVNYDMPDSADQYLHRVGRAGRFGTKGLAISFVATPEDVEVLNAVQSRFVVNVPIMPETIDSSTYMTS